MLKLKAKELRTRKATFGEIKKIKRNPIYIVCDNVLDTYNIGSIFRLADAVAAEEVILCGETETPPNTRIKKASINTTEWVKWKYTSTAVEAIKNLRKESLGIRVIAIEQDKKSTQFDKMEYTFPLAFVIGNETEGISKKVLAVTDEIAEIPMWGVNKSLNVMVSLGIVLYEAIKKAPFRL